MIVVFNFMNKEILEKIKKIAKNQNISLSSDDINKTLDELGLDSLSTMGIIVSIEKEYDVRIPDEILGNIKTLNQLVDTFDKLLKSKKNK